MENTPDLSIEHQNVPTNHQGLHDFLYSAADEHAVATSQPQLDLDSNSVLTLTDWQSRAKNARVAGVYAVLNSTNQTHCDIYEYEI